MTREKQLPKRKQNRLTELDYSAPGAYFITICTRQRENFFWDDVGAAIGRPWEERLSSCGRIVLQAFGQIPQRYDALKVDKAVVMPDHVHLLLCISAGEDGRAMPAPTVSKVVQQFKGAVSKAAGFPVWQKGFYDHVVRSRQDYLEIWKYIDENPLKMD